MSHLVQKAGEPGGRLTCLSPSAVAGVGGLRPTMGYEKARVKREGIGFRKIVNEVKK